MVHTDGIQWTNKSVLSFAGNENPVALIQQKARELVLRAIDAGWKGPPFNPLALADLLNIPVEPNADVPDARTIATKSGLKIHFNPTQARERVRFSIAHEIAHTLFPDVADEVRHRGGAKHVPDDWQLEMLCNLAAAEFVMPAGSLPRKEQVPSIETLMIERRQFDVSAEAFLIRVAKTTDEPLIMFCASPIVDDTGLKFYRIDYTVPSKTAPGVRLSGRTVPRNSAVYSCTAIGYTEKSTEEWFSEGKLGTECVGIPGYPGSRYPRVAGLIRFSDDRASEERIRYVHGNVLEPRGNGLKVICQLVNDQARTWGGGVAKSTARMFPDAHKEFSDWIMSIRRAERLGEVHFAEERNSIVIASLVAQEGYGTSSSPRIRYVALEECLDRVAEFASLHSASAHLPRIGSGQSGGSWETVEEILRATLVSEGVPVTVYDLPPKRTPSIPGLLIDHVR